MVRSPADDQTTAVIGRDLRADCQVMPDLSEAEYAALRADPATRVESLEI